MANNLCSATCLANYLQPQASHTSLQEIAADMQRRAGLTIQQKIGLNHITQFESLFDVKIVVFHRADNGLLMHDQTSDAPHSRIIHVYLHDEHYHRIVNLKAFIGMPYVCRHCFRGYTNSSDHRCKYTCDVCTDVDCYKNPGRPIYCSDCKRYCKSAYCYDKHKLQVPRSVSGMLAAPCDVTKFCVACTRRYHVSVEKPKPHRCAATTCPHCKQSLTTDDRHKCYIQPVKKRDSVNKYIFFDLETRFENGKHIANFACAITCGGKEFTAEGADCVARLLSHFRCSKYTGHTWLAHNAVGFDNILLMEYFSKIGVMPRLIMMGCRMIFMYDERFRQRYIDSYSFIPMRLANTPAAFNLTTDDKGYFPHRFNTSVNNNYIGPYPSKFYYGYDNMSDKEACF